MRGYWASVSMFNVKCAELVNDEACMQEDALFLVVAKYIESDVQTTSHSSSQGVHGCVARVVNSVSSRWRPCEHVDMKGICKSSNESSRGEDAAAVGEQECGRLEAGLRALCCGECSTVSRLQAVRAGTFGLAELILGLHLGAPPIKSPSVVDGTLAEETLSSSCVRLCLAMGGVAERERCVDWLDSGMGC
eukprot:6090452-Amphidinium_carterae.1